jgi:hypothetical protein
MAMLDIAVLSTLDAFRLVSASREDVPIEKALFPSPRPTAHLRYHRDSSDIPVAS